MFDCDRCDSDSQKHYGCAYLKGRPKATESLLSLEDSTKIYHIYQCPMSLISNETVRFYKRYSTYKRFNNAPAYEKMTKRFIEACNIYENSLAEFKQGTKNE